MSTLHLFDTRPLGMVAHPRGTARTRACKDWFRAALMAGLRFAVPEIADYEVRRELTRIGSARGLAKLDEIAETFSFLPVDRSVWLRAADLWARARNAGIPTAADAALDGDVILAATAQVAAEQGDQVIVVSANTRHLGRFVDAKTWESL